KRSYYVQVEPSGHAHPLPYAPYLDFRPLRDDEPTPEQLLRLPECAWICRGTEKIAQQYAIQHLAPQHLTEVRQRHLEQVQKTRTAVLFRLQREIAYYDRRADELKADEAKGKTNARLNSQQARQHAQELEERLHRRLDELDRETRIASAPPVALGGFVVVPAGLIAVLAGKPAPAQPTNPLAVAERARVIVMDIERQLGYLPTDREHEKVGYDIESRCPRTGQLRFIEVKGRISGAQTLTVTKNEILTSLNKPDAYILAIVEFFPDQTHRVHYLRQPFRREPDFGVTSVNYNFVELLQRAQPPA
ncbi:MAG: DUF3883 domain-containing protein, partial [Saprospiraceae bacterium]|nr:DUF3883 domain-containing protein [Saprospiraceae bacterium]MDW8231009.1 DUF3883 domain-containing protein [Saprospiraceae bacterium]